MNKSHCHTDSSVTTQTSLVVVGRTETRSGTWYIQSGTQALDTAVVMFLLNIRCYVTFAPACMLIDSGVKCLKCSVENKTLSPFLFWTWKGLFEFAQHTNFTSFRPIFTFLKELAALYAVWYGHYFTISIVSDNKLADVICAVGVTLATFICAVGVTLATFICAVGVTLATWFVRWEWH